MTALPDTAEYWWGIKRHLKERRPGPKEYFSRNSKRVCCVQCKKPLNNLSAHIVAVHRPTQGTQTP